MARYTQDFKDRAVARLLPPESAAIDVVARELGVSTATLERWRANALLEGSSARTWTAAARLDAVITSTAMNETERGAWCREHGVYPTDLDAWRASATNALAGPDERRATPQQTRADQRRIKDLEKELNRKEKALAETAALLVLSKKVSAIFHKDADA